MGMTAYLCHECNRLHTLADFHPACASRARGRVAFTDAPIGGQFRWDLKPLPVCPCVRVGEDTWRIVGDDTVRHAEPSWPVTIIDAVPTAVKG